MTTEQEDLKLRFQAGRFEQHLVSLILALQAGLIAMACLATAWTIYMTIGAYLSPRRPTLMYAHWMMYPIGAAVVGFLLDLLYE